MRAAEWDHTLGDRDPLPSSEADQQLLEALETMEFERYYDEFPLISMYAYAVGWTAVATNGVLMIDDSNEIMTFPLPASDANQSAYLRILKAPDTDAYCMAFAHNRISRYEEIYKSMGLDTSQPIRKMIVEMSSDSNYRIDSVISAMMFLAKDNDQFKALLGQMNTDVETVVSDVFARVFDGQSSRILRNRSNEYVQLMTMVADQAWPGWRKGENAKNFDRLGKLLNFQSRVPDWSYGRMVPSVYTLVYPEPIYNAIRKLVEAGIDPIMPHWALCGGYGHIFNDRYSDPCTGSLRHKCRSYERKIVAGLTNMYNMDVPGPTNAFPWELSDEWIEAFVAASDHLLEQPKTFDKRVNADLALQVAQTLPVFVIGQDQSQHFFHVDLSDGTATFNRCEAGDTVTVGN